MTEKILECIRSFCKRSVTVGRAISVLHKEFISFKGYPAIPIDLFEQGLRTLEKRVIKDLEKECLEYISIHGITPNSYNGFINEKEFITKKFWEHILNLASKSEKSERNPKKPSMAARISTSCESMLKYVVQKPVITTTTPPPALVEALKKEKPPVHETPKKKEELPPVPMEKPLNTEVDLPLNWHDLNHWEKESYIMNMPDISLLSEIIKNEKDERVIKAAHTRIDEIKGKREEKKSEERYFQGMKVLSEDLNVINTLAAISGQIPENFPKFWAKLSPEGQENIIMNVSDPSILAVMMKKIKKPAIVNMARKRWNELVSKKIVAKTTHIKEDKPTARPVKESPEDVYKSRLPLDWAKMALPERIGFARKIQDKKFCDYVLSLDPEVSSYLSRVKKEEPKGTTSLYVILFSVPSKTTSAESKALLKKFVESLNMLGRARLEYVESIEPPVVEIREVRR